jgi:hypothetical protein
VEAGIDSMSLDPDAVLKTALPELELEQRPRRRARRGARSGMPATGRAIAHPS